MYCLADHRRSQLPTPGEVSYTKHTSVFVCASITACGHRAGGLAILHSPNSITPRQAVCQNCQGLVHARHKTSYSAQLPRICSSVAEGLSANRAMVRPKRSIIVLMQRRASIANANSSRNGRLARTIHGRHYLLESSRCRNCPITTPRLSHLSQIYGVVGCQEHTQRTE